MTQKLLGALLLSLVCFGSAVADEIAPVSPETAAFCDFWNDPGCGGNGCEERKCRPDHDLPMGTPAPMLDLDMQQSCFVWTQPTCGGNCGKRHCNREINPAEFDDDAKPAGRAREMEQPLA